MMKPRDFTAQDIHLALDGEMPADEREAFDKWLDVNSDMRIRYARFEADGEKVRDSLAGVLDEPVPDALTAALASQSALLVRPNFQWRRLAAAALIFVIGSAAGYLYGARPVAPSVSEQRVFADNAIRAHDMYSAEKLHVVEVKADQRDHLQSWLSKRVGVPLIAPDLSPEGFELIGGRLLPDTGKAAAQFMYENSVGERVSLYVTRESSSAETGFKSQVEGATRALYWMEDDYGCAITGATTETTLSAIADATYRQLLANETH